MHRRTPGAGNAGFWHTRIHARGRRDPLDERALGDFMAAVGLEFVERPSEGVIRADLAHLDEHTFARMVLPAMRFRWLRGAERRDRFVVLSASVPVRTASSGPVLHREPGVVLIPPGDHDVEFTLDETTELVYVSSERSLLGDALVPTAVHEGAGPVSPATLLPLTSFVTGICAVNADDAQDAGAATHLLAVAREVVRAFVVAFAGEPEREDVFEAAMRIMSSEWGDRQLSGEVIAQRLGVSRRTLQNAFAARGTTGSVELRGIRAREARQLREGDPSLSAAAVAAMAGFGSVSSMLRAVRALDEALSD